MSSVPEIKNKIATLRAEFRYTKNESTKLTILKKLDNLNKELAEAQKAEKKTKLDNVQEQHQPKKDTNDINRGKVAEPGSNTSDNKQEEKKEDNKNQNNKKN